jgi:hypothetical protein
MVSHLDSGPVVLSVIIYFRSGWEAKCSVKYRCTWTGILKCFFRYLYLCNHVQI